MISGDIVYFQAQTEMYLGGRAWRKLAVNIIYIISSEFALFALLVFRFTQFALFVVLVLRFTFSDADLSSCSDKADAQCYMS